MYHYTGSDMGKARISQIPCIIAREVTWEKQEQAKSHVYGRVVYEEIQGAGKEGCRNHESREEFTCRSAQSRSSG